MGLEVVCEHCGSMDMVGVEIRRLYDGALFWECRSCEGTQHRFPKSDSLYDRAVRYIHGPIKAPVKITFRPHDKDN